MGRSPKFDYEEALDRATGLFWKHGYSGTSLRCLLRAMGIGEGSFYHAIKSKKQLYIECLDHYTRTVGRHRDAILTGEPTASLGIRAIFRALLDGLDDPQSPRACMVAGAVCGDVLGEPDLRACVSGHLSRTTEGLALRLAADQQAGLLPADFEPAVVAEILSTYIQGLYRSASIRYDRPQLERQIDTLLAGLGL